MENKNDTQLLVKVIDQDRIQDVYIDKQGRKVIFAKWKEVKEINIGSVNNPNKEVLMVKWQPRNLNDELPNSISDFFGKFLG